MADHPIDSVLVDGDDVAKSDFRSWAETRVRQRVANIAALRNANFAGAFGIDIAGIAWDRDNTDTTTEDDGTSCIVDSAGTRFKRINTPISVKRILVRVATTANITISTALNNGDTLNGVTLATGDLVLVKDQTDKSENGIYVVGSSPARHASFDTYDDHAGAFVAVDQGTTDSKTLWLCTANEGGTLDTDDIEFGKIGTSTGAPLSAPSFTGTVLITQGLAWTGQPVAGDILAANADNYDPTGNGTTVVLRVRASTAVSITGLAGGSSGLIKGLHNISANAITLPHESSSSTAANRFTNGDSRSVVLKQNDAAFYRYYSTANRWILLFTTSMDSLALTGTPTAPTAAAGTDTTQIATTAFVQAAITALKNGVSSTYDTLAEIATAITSILATTITGTGLATGGGALSANRTIDVPKASQAEVTTGTNDTKAVTPSAASVLALKTTTVTGSGLATGGGSLASNRVIDVPIASESEAQAGTENAKASTPLRVANYVAAKRGQASGIASLDSTGKVPTSQLPNAVLNADYQGAWNASTNSPTIPAAHLGNPGLYYIVSVAGTTEIDDVDEWDVGDVIISNGLTWERIPAAATYDPKAEDEDGLTLSVGTDEHRREFDLIGEGDVEITLEAAAAAKTRVAFKWVGTAVTRVSFVGEENATVECGLDVEGAEHRDIAFRGGVVIAEVWENTDDASAKWMLYGATKYEE